MKRTKYHKKQVMMDVTDADNKTEEIESGVCSKKASEMSNLYLLSGAS